MASAAVQHPHGSGHHSLQTKQGHETGPEGRTRAGVWGSWKLELPESRVHERLRGYGVDVCVRGCPLCPSTGRGPAGTRKWEKNRGQEELREEGDWEGLSLRERWE